MKISITPKELIVLAIFRDSSIDCCGTCGFKDNEENMSWNNARDLEGPTEWNIFEVSGVLGALTNKGLVYDSLTSARGLKINDFLITKKGLEVIDQELPRS